MITMVCPKCQVSEVTKKLEAQELDRKKERERDNWESDSLHQVRARVYPRARARACMRTCVGM